MTEDQGTVPIPARYSRVDPWVIGPAELARRFADQDAKEAMAYVQESLSRELSGNR